MPSVLLSVLFAISGSFNAVNIVSGNPSRTDFVASEIVRQHRTVGLTAFAPSLQFHVRTKADAEIGLESMTAAKDTGVDQVIVDNVDTFKRLKAALKDEDVALGILVQSSLGGHSGQVGPPAGWQRSEFLNGKVSQRTCVLEPKMHAYLKRAFTAMAQAKPAFILVDDDFSTRKHECCCPLHLALLSKALGRPVDKAEMQKVLGERPLDDPEYVKATDALYGAFEEIAKEIRAAIDAVDPTLRCGICSGGCMLGGLKRTALALAGPKTEPFVRFCNAVYGPQESYTVVHSVAMAERMRAYVEPIKDILCEGDTYPHNAMSTPAVRFNAALANNALSGIGGVKLWMSDFRHDRFVDGQRRYETIYREWDGFRMELLRLAREGIAWRGVAAVVFDPEIRLAPVKRDDGIDPWYEYPAMILAPYGLPIRYARPGAGGIFAVSAGEAKMLSKAEREALVKGPLVLDPKCGDLFPERGEKTYVSAVSPLDPFYARYSTPAREKFKAEIDRLSDGVLEMSLEIDQPAFVRHGVLKDGRELVVLTSLSEDPLVSLPLRLVRTPKTVEKLGKGGTWNPVAWERTAKDVVTVRTGAAVYEVVALRFEF